MSILHGSWLSDLQGFFLWGENWRSLVNEVSLDEQKHPFNLNQKELISLLEQHNLEAYSEQNFYQPIIVQPSRKQTENDLILPILSKQIETNLQDNSNLVWYEWEIEGLLLKPQEAVKFLQSLPLNSLSTSDDYIGSELRFWSHIYRWSLDLLARYKFLPGIKEITDDPNNITIDNNGTNPSPVAVLSTHHESCWQPLLDSTLDQTRLAKFTQLMPLACLAYYEVIDPEVLLLDFLQNIIDAQLRQWLEKNPAPIKGSTIQLWLQSLSQESRIFDGETKEIKRLQTALDNWTFPIQEYLVNTQNQQLTKKLFRTCFVLEPPSTKNNQFNEQIWHLKYYLQALDDPDWLLDAETIWQSPVEQLSINERKIKQPQESLLKGLGLASRLYEPIGISLEEKQPLFCALNPIQVYEFLRGKAWQLQDNGLGVIVPPSLVSGIGEKRLGIKVTAEVTPKKGERLSLQTLLNYQLHLAIGDQIISKQEFENILATQSPLVEINGQWIALQPTDVKAAQAILNQSYEQINLSVEDALRLSTEDTKTLAKLPVVKFESSGILKTLIENLTNNQSLEILPTPQEFNGRLRPYQQKGFSWLAFLEQWSLGACLADDMGLGKTIQLIAFLLHLKTQNALQHPTLLICPTSVLSNWQREVQKFAPTLSTFIHHGEQRKKGKTFAQLVNNKHLVITSYPLAYRDENTLTEVYWQGIVLDEAQNIKNSQAKQSQSIRQLKAGFKTALTGTPVENHLSELWSIIDFLNPGILGNRQFFQRRFAIPVEKYGDKESLQNLRSLVQPFILRRLKTDKDIIQDLPEKQEMNVYCSLSLEQAKIYQNLVDEFLAKIEEATGIKRRGLILTLLLRLKQLCNHPNLIENDFDLENQILCKNFSQRSGKLLRLEEMLDELVIEGDRALIFTQFAEWGKLLQPYLEKRLGVKVLFLYGATRRQNRQEMVDSFQNDPQGAPIFILSLKAGGTGLNLTRANHVFHVDRWWNPAVENQATDRAFRIGQKRNVQVHKFVCTGTLEEKINDIIESKKQLAEHTIDAGENWLTELDTNQLRNLLLLDRNSIIDEEDE